MNPSKARDLFVPLALLAIGALGISFGRSFLFWLSSGLAIAGFFTTLRGILLVTGVASTSSTAAGLLRAGLLLFSISFGFAVFEVALAIIEVKIPPELFETPDRGDPLPVSMRPESIYVSPDRDNPLAVTMPGPVARKAEMMRSAVTMPIAWEHRWIRKVKGEPKEFMWHGVYHVYDLDKFRKLGAFPPRTPGRARIIAIGDSVTYGKAIAGFWSYPTQLERALARNQDVEVLNLGSPGLPSAQILEKLQTYLPKLEPDLVFYGAYLNDFEPIDYQPERPWLFPIPRNLEKFIMRRTRVGRFLNHRYAEMLRDLGARPDFYSNILVDFEARSNRFGRDVAAMNALVREAGLPPMITMLLNSDTSRSEQNKLMVTIAESKLRDAGMTVIESTPFSDAFAGHHFGVSRWDGHPNEEANAIWSKILYKHFRSRPELAPQP
jgi:hypothetical protein